MTRGKTHGSVDVGLSVISTKSQRRRIDIDAEEHIYHLKVRYKEKYFYHFLLIQNLFNSLIEICCYTSLFQFIFI